MFAQCEGNVTLHVRNANGLLCVDLHWHVPFIEVLLGTVQVVW